MDKHQEVYDYLDKIENDPAFPSTKSATALLKMKVKKPSPFKIIALWISYGVMLGVMARSIFLSNLTFQVIHLINLGFLSFTIVEHYKWMKLKAESRDLYIEKIHIIIKQSHLTDAEKMIYLIAHQIITPH